VKNQPKEIYLHTGIQGSDKGMDFKRCAFITWSDDRIYASDLEYVSKYHLKRVLLARLNKYRSELVRLQAPKMDKTTPMCREAIHEKTVLIQELKYLIDKLDV
jgi:hypothetical protein